MVIAYVNLVLLNVQLVIILLIVLLVQWPFFYHLMLIVLIVMQIAKAVQKLPRIVYLVMLLLIFIKIPAFLNVHQHILEMMFQELVKQRLR
jgi:hypothetical protein